MIEYKRRAKKRRIKKILITLGILLLVLCLGVGLLFLCTVRRVEVVGNDHYSQQQIEEVVLPTKWDHNTVYLLYKSHYGKFDVPPFLDMVEVDVLSYNKIRIHVYEKTVVGYVVYGGKYVCFDKDGTVLEISDDPREGLPVVKGLYFEKMKLYEKLPVQDKEVFKTLVTLTRMLSKESLNPDRIEFIDGGQMDITFGEVLVHLGKDEHLDNKIARLTGILPKVEGRSGILHMEDVDESTERITFTKTGPPTVYPQEDGDYVGDEEDGEDDGSGDAGDDTGGEDSDDYGDDGGENSGDTGDETGESGSEETGE